MRWSQLKVRVESEFAEELGGRVSVHVTRHHSRSRSGRGWITIDGIEVANFCDWSVYADSGHEKPPIRPMRSHGSGPWEASRKGDRWWWSECTASAGV